MRPRIVIVGGGVAGMRALVALRRQLPESRVTLIDRRTTSEEMPASNALEFTALVWGADFLLGCVERIDPHRREVLLDDGRFLRFDRLLLAYGSVDETEPLVARSALAEAARIPTDEAMRHMPHPRVYAAGACAAPPITYLRYDTMLQADIAVASIVSDNSSEVAATLRDAGADWSTSGRLR